MEIDCSEFRINNFTPPEFFDKSLYNQYNQSFDYWSLGVIVFWMIAKEYPFQNESEIKEKIIPNLTEKDLFQGRIPSKELNDFIQELLNKNPNKRLGSDSNSQDIRDIAFFNKIDWLNLKNTEPTYKPFPVSFS